MSFNADASRLVTAGVDRTYRVWNLADDRLEAAFEASVTSPKAAHSTASVLGARFSPDGTQILTAAGSELKVLRVGREPLLEELGAGIGAMSARLSASERYVALVTQGEARVEIWDLATHARVASRQLGKVLWDVSWSPDDRHLVTCGSEGRVLLLSRDGTLVRSFEGHAAGESVNRAAWNPDGTRIITTSDDHTARIWNVATGEALVLRHPHRVLGSSWSADSSRVATAGWDGALRVWDATTGTVLTTIHDDELRFLDVGLSPDGTRIAASSHAGVVAVWDLASGRRVLSLNGHTGPVTAVVWSPDGTRLASSSSDGSARVWDAATGRQVAVRPNRGEGLQVSWNRAGTQIIVAAGDPAQTVRIWDVAPDRRPLAALVELVASWIRWKLVDGRLEVASLAQ
ncbi:MAG: WD40 repeat domain-containing protein [Kofleriaceae bacterium]